MQKQIGKKWYNCVQTFFGRGSNVAASNYAIRVRTTTMKSVRSAPIPGGHGVFVEV